MKKLGKVLAAAALVVVVLLVALWVAVVPRELKTLVAFWRWHDAHLRASGDVPRAPAGTRIHWEEFGAPDGPPVVVLHAGLTAIAFMGGQITPLADASFRVIAIEERGHGRSPSPAPTASYEVLGDDVIAVLDALGIGHADVVGWSDGGIVGLDLALRSPDRVRRLVAFGANRSPDGLDPAPTQEFRDATADGDMFAPLRLLYQQTSPTPERWPAFFEQERALALTQPNWSLAQLAAIRAPVLLINGEHDLVLPAHAVELQGAIPGARLEVVPGEGHEVPLANPAAVTPLMIAFLRQE